MYYLVRNALSEPMKTYVPTYLYQLRFDEFERNGGEPPRIAISGRIRLSKALPSTEMNQIKKLPSNICKTILKSLKFLINSFLFYHNH